MQDGSDKPGTPSRSVEMWEEAPALLQDFLELLPRLGADEGISEWARNYASYHVGRCKWDARFLAMRSGCERFLNIGGAPFLFEFALKQLKPDASITTLDIAPERFPHAASAFGLSLIAGDIERTDCRFTENFDCIIMAEIFEHLRIDLFGTLSRVRNALAPGGLLYLTMPNGLGFNAVRNHLLRGRTGPSLVVEWEKLRRLGHMGHVREYSALEAQEALRHCGFTIERTIFRRKKEGKWPLRDTLVKLRPSLADEIVILARA